MIKDEPVLTALVKAQGNLNDWRAVPDSMKAKAAARLTGVEVV